MGGDGTNIYSAEITYDANTLTSLTARQNTIISAINTILKNLRLNQIVVKRSIKDRSF